MTVAIVTKEDLQEFKTDLLNDIKKLLHSGETTSNKKWLKSKEVIQLLKISPGTLQTLRSNGNLTYTKIGGTFYYENTDIDKLLKTNKVAAIPTVYK